MTDQNPGNNPPSGRTTRPARSPWKALAQELEQQVRELQAELSTVKTDYEDLQKGYLKPREATKLHALEHFYRRVLNAPVGGEAREYLDKICEESVWVLGRNNHDTKKDQ